MTRYTWNTGSGAFASATNWTPTGTPGTGDTAAFGAGSGTISGPGSVATLQLDPGGTWSWTGSLQASAFNINANATLSNGAIWTLGGTPSSANYIVVGPGANGNGTLTIANGASITSSQAASTTNYALYVGSGTQLSANGVVTVTGSGSAINTGPNGAAIGQDSTGVMNVQTGGAATFKSSDSSQIAALSIGRQGTGTLAVSGNSSVTASGFVTAGRAGSGTINLSSGSTFTGGQAASAQAASYSVNIGDSTPSTSTTAYFGGRGTLSVTTGATLHSLSGINIGQDGTTGVATVDGAGSTVKADGTIQVGDGTQRVGGNGTLTIQNGGTVRAGIPATGIAAIAIGSGMTGDTGTVTVTGAGSLLDANGYRISLGSASSTSTNKLGGSGTLTIAAGAHVLSGASYTDTESALSLAAFAGGSATVSVDGAGSQLVANGAAIFGGTIINGQPTSGGTATITVTHGGLLQTGAETIYTGSTLTVDAASRLATPSITIEGGAADLGTLDPTTAIGYGMHGAGGTLRLHAVSGSNTVANFGAGDTIDFVGTQASINGSTVTAGGGTVTLAGIAPTGGYQLVDDGRGGSQIVIPPDVVAPKQGVFRFFEQTNGTHFYTSNAAEAQGLANPTSSSYRADLTPETNGFGAYGQTASDPNQTQVFRFFDQTHGTEFLTASKSEADGLQAVGSPTYRTDLTLEASSSFYEHSTQQAGDVAVYRFFDKTFGTHFYTGSQDEYKGITTPGTPSFRTDLTFEGIGFYAPAGSYAPSTTLG